MDMRTVVVAAGMLAACGATNADELTLSIGVRETGGSGPSFSDAGAQGGIEWVNRDGQVLATDGVWRLFTFTPSTDPLLAFAGTTANSLLDTDWGSLEHIRILNTQGLTGAVRLWIDDLTNTFPGGSATEGFEGFSEGDEVIFQEPGLSGSTAANVVAGGTSGVSSVRAHSGSQSYEVNLQFVDDDPARWVRLTTFDTDALANPAMLLRSAASGEAPTISFWAAAVIPEPSSAALAGLAGAGLCLARRRGAR